MKTILKSQLKRKALVSILNEVDKMINVLNINYVGTDSISDSDFEETFKSLKDTRNFLLDKLSS